MNYFERNYKKNWEQTENRKKEFSKAKWERKLVSVYFSTWDSRGTN
jgi:hypothetical protein